VPHIDFHFYIVPQHEVAKVRPGPCSELIDCDDFERARIPVPAGYVHADHIDVGAAVPDMGNHLIDAKSPELAPGGPAFTHTFILGACDGKITFYEPMITLAYLETKPDLCLPIKQPQASATAGHTPPPTASATCPTRNATPSPSKTSCIGQQSSRGDRPDPSRGSGDDGHVGAFSKGGLTVRGLAKQRTCSRKRFELDGKRELRSRCPPPAGNRGGITRAKGGHLIWLWRTVGTVAYAEAAGQPRRGPTGAGRPPRAASKSLVAGRRGIYDWAF
jgi:hypothetical protein